ncbi:hypothetical protein TRFO_40639 [Tritrichomonas foetus]|uniref:Uncharacterized protein n=1 Tax=Tritrichomonas foetus TaxID=1144522 RepID=A0A1J4J6H6_9EUKA|nr:hypothetical protein TRFO_40639 [Tritrichomonas foetus]|eukprot:OHS93037.1 hypothetical protein TRFO_40639 [Tritrichomonas foetus]
MKGKLNFSYKSFQDACNENIPVDFVFVDDINNMDEFIKEVEKIKPNFDPGAKTYQMSPNVCLIITTTVENCIQGFLLDKGYSLSSIFLRDSLADKLRNRSYKPHPQYYYLYFDGSPQFIEEFNAHKIEADDIQRSKKKTSFYIGFQKMTFVKMFFIELIEKYKIFPIFVIEPIEKTPSKNGNNPNNTQMELINQIPEKSEIPSETSKPNETSQIEKEKPNDENPKKPEITVNVKFFEPLKFKFNNTIIDFEINEESYPEKIRRNLAEIYQGYQGYSKFQRNAVVQFSLNKDKMATTIEFSNVFQSNMFVLYFQQELVRLGYQGVQLNQKLAYYSFTEANLPKSHITKILNYLKSQKDVADIQRDVINKFEICTFIGFVRNARMENNMKKLHQMISEGFYSPRKGNKNLIFIFEDLFEKPEDLDKLMKEVKQARSVKRNQLIKNAKNDITIVRKRTVIAFNTYQERQKALLLLNTLTYQGKKSFFRPKNNLYYIHLLPNDQLISKTRRNYTFKNIIDIQENVFDVENLTAKTFIGFSTLKDWENAMKVYKSNRPATLSTKTFPDDAMSQMEFFMKTIFNK